MPARRPVETPSDNRRCLTPESEPVMAASPGQLQSSGSPRADHLRGQRKVPHPRARNPIAGRRLKRFSEAKRQSAVAKSPNLYAVWLLHSSHQVRIANFAANRRRGATGEKTGLFITHRTNQACRSSDGGRQGRRARPILQLTRGQESKPESHNHCKGRAGHRRCQGG